MRGQEGAGRAGLDPWRFVREDERFYGRGSADNKGQHTTNLGAFAAAIETRGRLGFDLKVLVETRRRGRLGRAARSLRARERAALAGLEIEANSGGPTVERPAIVPNLGGSLPNDAFAQLLGLTGIRIPHSYVGCSQQAPNERLLAPVACEALALMARLFWSLGKPAELAHISPRGRQPAA